MRVYIYIHTYVHTYIHSKTARMQVAREGTCRHPVPDKRPEPKALKLEDGSHPNILKILPPPPHCK